MNSTTHRASMPALVRWIALAAAAGAFTASAAAAPIPARDRPAQGHAYVSPLPGSDRVSPANNVAIRPGGVIDPRTVWADLFTVTGSVSGRHAGSVTLSDDGRTLIFLPARSYAPGEKVTVALAAGVRTREGRPVPPLRFDFEVAPRPPVRAAAALENVTAAPASARPAEARPAPRASASDLPPDFPPIVILASNDPDPVCLFLDPFTNEASAPLVIVDHLGMPIYYHRESDNLMDFKRQGAFLTYFNQMKNRAYVMDSTYAVVDSFEAGNGYHADFHDFQLLPDGHSLLLCYDGMAVGMDTVVAGGDPDAHVIGLVIQELDASKNVVFQWRSWDHFAITDAVNVDLTSPLIDYVHGNTIEVDTDGNLMISSRHLNEITKIDRNTGDVIWRWGLNAVHNDFTFIGDTRGFAHQHDVRRAPNGHVTLFDNGNFLSPQYSRALEYALDEVNMTATLVRSYRPVPDGFSQFAGGVQPRADGGWLVGWGAGTVIPDVTDLRADGTRALEITFDPPAMTSYRAYRFPWRGTRLATDHEALAWGAVPVDSAEAKTLQITNNGATDLTVTSFVLTDSVSYSVAPAAPLLVPAGGTVQVEVTFHPIAHGALDARLYVRSATTLDLVAQVVDLAGFGANPGVLLPGAGRPVLLALAFLTAAGAVVALRRRRALV